MKLTIAILTFLSLSFPSIQQNFQHETLTVNIEVPVRVYSGDRFIYDLTIDDFLLTENGIPQKLDAVYLIKERSIERSEEVKRFSPNTARSFYLFFEIAEYTPRINEALEYFVNEILFPGDSLVIVTPMKTYRMKPETISRVPKDIFIEQFRGILRKDAWTGSSEYRNALEDLTALVRSFSGADSIDPESSSGLNFEGSLEEKLQTYVNLRSRLENMRKVDQSKLLDFAEYLKDKEGQKSVFLFYQREFMPEVTQEVYNHLMTGNQDNPSIQLDSMSNFGLNTRDVSFDVERVKQAYSNSSITIHFLFFSQPSKQVSGIQMVEHSEDIFSAFNEMAMATGGLTGSSSNPGYLFKMAGEASSNYYLLYYTPKDYRADGKFMNIEVKIRSGGYRVNHRAGYFAN